MRIEIIEYMDKGLICQKGQRSVGELRPLEIPTWNWDFNGLCHGILSDIVSYRGQRFQAYLGMYFKDPLKLY